MQRQGGRHGRAVESHGKSLQKEAGRQGPVWYNGSRQEKRSRQGASRYPPRQCVVAAGRCVLVTEAVCFQKRQAVAPGVAGAVLVQVVV